MTKKYKYDYARFDIRMKHAERAMLDQICRAEKLTKSQWIRKIIYNEYCALDDVPMEMLERAVELHYKGKHRTEKKEDESC